MDHQTKLQMTPIEPTRAKVSFHPNRATNHAIRGKAIAPPNLEPLSKLHRLRAISF
jgi:hypothetical protein